MSYTDVLSTITTMQTNTNSVNYEKNKSNTDNTMDEDMFLQLMMTQLQYQDPLDPMDNSEFLSQQATFTQVSTLQEMNENLETYGEAIVNSNSALASSSVLSQATSLVGQQITATDPNNASETISGTVESVKLSSDGGYTLTVNGQEIPSSNLLTVNGSATTSTTTMDDDTVSSYANTFINTVLNNPNLQSAVSTTIDTLIGKLF